MNNNSSDIDTYKTYIYFNIFFISICIIVIVVSIIYVSNNDKWGWGIGIGAFLLITNWIFYVINRDKKRGLEISIEVNKINRELAYIKIYNLIDEITQNINDIYIINIPKNIKNESKLGELIKNLSVEYKKVNDLEKPAIYNYITTELPKQISKTLKNKYNNNKIKTLSIEQNINEKISQFIYSIINKFKFFNVFHKFDDDTIKYIEKSGTDDTIYDETRVDKYIEDYHKNIIEPNNFLKKYNKDNALDMRNDVLHYFNNSDNYKTVLSDDIIKSTYTTDKLNSIYNGLNKNAKGIFLGYVKELLPDTIKNKNEYINLITKKPIKGSNNYTTSRDINNIKTKFDHIIAEYQNNTAAPFTKDPTLETNLKQLVNETSLDNIKVLQNLINTNNTISQQVKNSVNIDIIHKHIKQRSLSDA
jgi:hypothetical protein